MAKNATRLAMIVVFVSGMVIGAVCGLAGSRAIVRKIAHATPEKLQRTVMKKLDGRLQLRADQHPLVEREVHHALVDLGALRNQARSDFVRILDETGRQLEGILDDRQNATLDAMLSAVHAQVEGRQTPEKDAARERGGCPAAAPGIQMGD